MKRLNNLSARVLRGAAGVAASLAVASCGVYLPLGRGADVPWHARNDRAVEPSGPVHRVERGDTLSQLASRYGVPMAALARVNDLRPPYTIYVGETLKLPAPAETEVAAAPGAQSGPEPETGPETEVAAAPAAPSGSDGDRDGYVVRRGDTLNLIASRLEVPARALARANDIDPPYAIYPGQRLDVPDAAAEVVTARREPAAGTLEDAPDGEPPALSGEGFLWPVDGKVVGRFGQGEGGRGAGIDIAARKGTPVRAAENGLVVYAGDAIRGYGRMILLRHQDGYVTTYAHNSALLVDVDEVVGRGQAIARVGDSGGVASAQLHFELRKGREPVDPESVLVESPTAVASTE